MKIYAILYDNDESYADNHKWVDDKAFRTYRQASQYMIDLGFEPYGAHWSGDYFLIFFRQVNEYESVSAEILELKLEESE